MTVASSINHTLADQAARIRTRNLAEVLARKALPEPGGRLTPFQRQTIETCRFAGLTALSSSDGTVKVCYLQGAPSGGATEEWRNIVTPRDLTNHLADAYGT